MEYSLPAWLGALVGTIVAAAIYIPGIKLVERRLRTGPPKTLEAHAAFEEKLSVIRRLILGADIAVFAVIGYWIGTAVGARWAGG